MKITIDTKEDSREDILRVIKMLQNLVSQGSNGSEVYTNQGNIFEQANPELPTGNALGDFFANANKVSEEEKNVDKAKVVEYY